MSRRLLPALLAAACASGCVATQRDVAMLEQQTDEVKAQVMDLKGTIAGLRANQADLAVKMEQLHADVNAFNETMKDSQNSMTRLSSKLDDLQAALGQKVSGLGETLSKQQSDLAARLAAQQAGALTAAEAAWKETGAGRLFRSAQAQLQRKEYAAAAKGFETYLERHPKGEMVEPAVYYLGEARYGLKSWEEAARRLAALLDRYPKSDLIPAARLKYALCLLQLKTRLPEAKRYLQSIPEDYPKSPEAAAAQKLLQKFPDAAPAPSKTGKG